VSEWYDDRRNLAAVARHMGERGDTVDDVAYMLEKPEKFEDDWERLFDQTEQRAKPNGRVQR
jgi:hypothetical protein